MEASTWKLKALIKKNLLEMKRNLFSSFCEIFFPIILMFLVLLLKSAFKVEKYTFKEEEGDNFGFMKHRSIVNLNFSSKNYDINDKWNGMNLLPIFNICSSENEQQKERPKIALINVPDDIKETFIKDSNKYGDYPLSNTNFKKFSSFNEMKEYIQNNAYGEDEEHALICFGISFSYENPNYTYALHYFEKKLYDGAEDIKASQYILDQFQSGPDMESYEKYQQNG
jgi:hypothetical protein